ncbi:AprI/Inh family metalloprotease inhibitor [Microbaculum marinum]|uniref:AprI/Inh family metalloprotease inhibitor n=1 Tax=Microbaculum marinum TaxID=1764581 RepID=A0AAW9RRM4_9HYPH
MTSRISPAIGVLLITLPLVAACSSNSSRVRPLPPAPTGPVVSQPLPTTPQPTTPDPNAPPPVEAQAPLPEEQQVAAVPPAQDKPTQEGVLGQWALSSPADSCQLFVTLTGWTGGYRASTRGCGSPELKSVGAWNIEGDLVVLKDNDGNAVARLAKTGATQYNGRLDLGGTVSMSR